MDKYVIVDNKSWRNLTGMTFGKWLILGYIGNKKFECKWSDNEEQSNNKRNCTLITYENETLTLSQQCRRFNLKIETIRSRLRLRWSIEKTFSKKINKYSPIVK